MGLLQAPAEPALELLDIEKIDAVADKGYFETEDIAACEGGIDAVCAEATTRFRAATNEIFARNPRKRTLSGDPLSLRRGRATFFTRCAEALPGSQFLLIIS
jgi:hypothetical protein